MLFTNIQLDDFMGMLAHFFKMEGDSVEECEWMMMGVVNLGTILEYGRASGVIWQSGSLGTRESSSSGGAGVNVTVKKPTTPVEDADSKMDIDDGKLSAAGIKASPATSEVDEAKWVPCIIQACCPTHVLHALLCPQKSHIRVIAVCQVNTQPIHHCISDLPCHGIVPPWHPLDPWMLCPLGWACQLFYNNPLQCDTFAGLI